jgi:hypothetical protein
LAKYHAAASGFVGSGFRTNPNHTLSASDLKKECKIQNSEFRIQELQNPMISHPKVDSVFFS